MLKQYSIEEIKNQLIECCISKDTASFIPYLLSRNVSVDYINKLRFYKFLKYMVKGNMGCSKRTFNFKIEKLKIDNDLKSYDISFYDNYHLYPRVILEIIETENRIFIEVSPF